MKMKRIQYEIGSPRAALRAAAVLFLLVVFAASAALAYERQETFQKSLPLQGAKRIIVTNSRGDVKVIGEKGRSDVFCEYTKSIRGRDQDEADRLFNLMDIEVTREGSGLRISVRYPDRSERDRNILAMLVQHYAGLSVDLNIAVPPELGVEVVSASGDIELASILGAAVITSASGDVEAVVVGDLKVDVSSGDLTVSEVSGKAVLSSSSGSIEAHKIRGNLSVRCSSGDVVLSEVGGDLAVEAAMGDVSVEGVRNVDYSGSSGSASFSGVSGAVTAIAASGDIEVDAAPESIANYEMRTSSGRVGLMFERVLKSGFALKVQTTSGDIATTLPITVTKVGRHYLIGVVREGKSIVVLETASGDIDVSEPEE
jgi:DUF4097 and DUF4098 domain-containing protein YvlB